MKKYTEPSKIFKNSDDLNYKLLSSVNYGEYVMNKILENKNGIALINGESGEQITYGEIAQQVINTASFLIDLGVDAGDVIGVCSENRNEFLITAIAGMCTEGVVTFLNNAYNKDELKHTLKISKPKYVFLSPKTYESYYKTMASLEFIKKFFIFGPSSVENVTSFAHVTSKHVNIDSFRYNNYNGEIFKYIKKIVYDTRMVPLEGHPYLEQIGKVLEKGQVKSTLNRRDVVLIGAEKTALILYSSGTTGLPKGAKLSHRNLIVNGCHPLNYKRGMVCLSVAPWTNTVGIMLTLLAIINNETIVYLSKFNEENYLNSIEKYKVNLLLAVPPLIFLLNHSKLLQSYDVSSVEIIYCGGAPLDSSVMDIAKKRFPNLKHVLQGYGMTEATGAITEEDDIAPRQGSVGRVINGIIVKVVDVETRKLLGPNEPGEVCIGGPVVFQGYIGKDMSEYLDDEGFYCTGDIAYYDEDGYFFIVDRIKELIKYKAGQVAPSELEAILNQHPAVRDAGVIGIPDPLAGELPAAFVVKVIGASVTEKELVDFVGSKVSSWKQLRGGVKFVQEIPKNASGKILRRKLRAMIAKPVSKI